MPSRDNERKKVGVKLFLLLLCENFLLVLEGTALLVRL